MNELLSDKAIDKLVILAVWVAFLLFFWVLDSVWRNDKRWLLPIFILPVTICGFIFEYWEETRAKCFFTALYAVTLLFLGAATGFSFIYRVGMILLQVGFWPYYAYKYVLTVI